MKKELLLLVAILFGYIFLQKADAQPKLPLISEITESTPSKSIYFDWINRNWYGSNEKKIEANLKFFKWLHDEYGMELDIYLMDAGDIDQGPVCSPLGLPAYGSLETELFKRRFPNGFGPLVELAKSFGCRLGIWLGPDGYGSTAEEAMKRKEMLVKFCKDYNFALFKFDACCSDLSPENQKYFIETMKECRKYTPDLIILNHRITLNEEARELTTTFLWEGRETYVDVNISNSLVAPHHRETNLSRGVPPGLMRLTEDHGVCLSSALEGWEDDLILQAFNRNLILSPEIYGSPFLLNDEMFPRLARIYNIHRLYNEILVDGMALPEEDYGKNAISRGDSSTRLVTLRNLSWLPKQVSLKLDESIGLLSEGEVEVLQYHPTERFLGKYASGSEVRITVMPFRASLVKVSVKANHELILKGIDYQIKKNLPNHPVHVELFGNSGEKIRFSLIDNNRKYHKASINGIPVSSLLQGDQISYRFPGKHQKLTYLKELGYLDLADIPENPEKYFEACIFATDNNALEVRELKSSGKTNYPQVQEARDVFFKDTLFSGIGVWDKYAFDADLSTSFKVRRYEYNNLEENNGVFRLNMGEIMILDTIVFKGIPDNFNPEVIEVSTDLSNWYSVQYTIRNDELTASLSGNRPLRYLRLAKSPVRVAEIEGYFKGVAVNRAKWTASNLSGLPSAEMAKYCWKYEGKLSGIGKEAKLSVTVPAKCKEGTVFAMMVVNGKITGANDRAPSFPYNNWEHYSVLNGQLTFYIPVDKDLEGKTVQVIVLTTDNDLKEVKPEVWLTNSKLYEKAELILE